MIWYATPKPECGTELDWTGPNRTGPDRVGTHLNAIQQNTGKCAKHKTLNSYWSTKMDNVVGKRSIDGTQGANKKVKGLPSMLKNKVFLLVVKKISDIWTIIFFLKKRYTLFFISTHY